jgi:segregation and condensation protein B
LKLSSPKPSAKSRFVAKLPEPQVDHVAVDESSEPVGSIQSDFDDENEDHVAVESELEQDDIEADFEAENPPSTPELTEPESSEHELEQDLCEKVDEDDVSEVTDVALGLDTILGEASEELNETELAESEAESTQANTEERAIVQLEDNDVAAEQEIADTESPEPIVAQQNMDSGIDLLKPALHLPMIEMEACSDSLADATIISPVEIAESSEQPIAEFVSHKLINMEIKHIVEAALFASGSAMSVSRLYRVFDEDERPERSEIRAALTILQQDYADKAVQLVEVAGGFRFQVKADYASWIARLFEERPPKYSRALLETLSIIAYRQPVTRGDIENIRGVAVSTHIIHTLQEREWVKVVGHKEVPGKPALFATTTEFLDYFNLKSLTELSPLSEFIIPDLFPEQLQDASIEDETDQQNQQAEEDQASEKD